MHPDHQNEKGKQFAWGHCRTDQLKKGMLGRPCHTQAERHSSVHQRTNRNRRTNQPRSVLAVHTHTHTVERVQRKQLLVGCRISLLPLPRIHVVCQPLAAQVSPPYDANRFDARPIVLPVDSCTYYADSTPQETAIWWRQTSVVRQVMPHSCHRCHRASPSTSHNQSK